VWVPKTPGDTRPPNQIPESERNYFLEFKYPSFGNLVPRDVASRNVKEVCDQGLGVGPAKYAVYLDLSDAIRRDGVEAIRKRYGNLFQMYEKITGQSPYEVPMMIYPAVHYAMGGLWVDYNLMSTIPGLFVLGEAALMQGLADGYFIIPYAIGGYLAGTRLPEVKEDHRAFSDASRQASQTIDRLLSVKGKRTPADFHRELGRILWEHVGMSREEQGMRKAKELIPGLRQEFWEDVTIPGSSKDLNQALERANRVADFLEFAELMIDDALYREESCGCHFNVAFQTEDHEALRVDETCSYVAAWEYKGAQEPAMLVKEPLKFEYVEPATRSYK
jgi:succinate dehydrogenase / fumarate reductase flavoprotein subunit